MKVLVADDDDSFRSLVIEILTEAGYQVAAEVNGLLAWERLQAEGADMAVLDINMPQMDGFEVLRHIRTDDRFKNMPVLMLTIRAFAEDQVAGYETGADDYLTKPFDAEVFLARVRVLERRILKD
ncbi:MAG: response regulator transcription factor [Elusimicrobiales bacterium]|jgi:DNA-binding response OmpR family regulator